jgi:hypothetical protein
VGRGIAAISADPEMMRRAANPATPIAHFALDFQRKRSVCGGHGQRASRRLARVLRARTGRIVFFLFACAVCQGNPSQGVKLSSLFLIKRLWRPLARLPPTMLFERRKDPPANQAGRRARSFN